MKALTLAALLLACPRADGLRVYFIDVEGGAATLVVTPEGESVLFDSGSAGARDPQRIARAARDAAGLAKIDHHVISHWHDDHYGGTEQLSALIPISTYYDKGPSVEKKNFDAEFAWYLKLSKDRRRILKAGDAVPLRSVKLLCVAAEGKVVPGKGENPLSCKLHPAKEEDTSDNARSIALMLSFGSFRLFAGGDLTWNVEHQLACPDNRVGPVDVFLVNHHGLALSNNPALVDALRPRVAIFNNGARKGAEESALEVVRAGRDLKAMFQLHRNVRTGPSKQAPSDSIANDEEQCRGEFIRLDVDPSGKTYRVTVKGKPVEFAVR